MFKDIVECKHVNKTVYYYSVFKFLLNNKLQYLFQSATS